ncbi:transposase [Paenibacillus rhizoplanae]
MRKDLLPRLQKYEQYQKLLGDRNSFSKTDPEATFMRMKEDHMRNGQLKPGYNVQIGTEKPIYFNLQYTSKTNRHPLFRAASGKKAQQILGKWPKTVIADAGYGSEENYAYLEKERDTGGGEVQQLPQGKRLKPGKRMLVKIENWTYDTAGDHWTCPAGNRLHFHRESKETLESGYDIRRRHYRSSSCEGCPLKERCTKAAGNREVVVSLERLRYQKQAREILRSEEGYTLAVRRMTEPESVFGQLKNNRGVPAISASRHGESDA